MINKIETLENVRTFFKQLSAEELNFHPDTPFEDYINLKTNEPTYTGEQAKLRNKLLNECFDVCEKEGADIYEIAAAEIERL